MSTIVIQLSTSVPPAPDKTKASKFSVEDDIRAMIECIESGHDSAVEWITLNKVFKTLTAKKDQGGPRGKKILEMIKPIMSKYGQHGTPIAGA